MVSRLIWACHRTFQWCGPLFVANCPSKELCRGSDIDMGFHFTSCGVAYFSSLSGFVAVHFLASRIPAGWSRILRPPHRNDVNHARSLFVLIVLTMFIVTP